MTGLLRFVMVALALFAILLMYSARAAWRKRNAVSAGVTFITGALLGTLSLLCAVITVGVRGYRAFTAEQVAATIRTEPLGPHHFRATVTLADSSLHMFDLAGDAVYIDAHVLKWRTIGTFLGLQTAYELDRIAGRYQALSDEQQREHTVYTLARHKPFNAYDLAHYWVLRPLVDAEYGSATFISATKPAGATYELRVSTTGLLVRPSGTR